MPSSRQATTTLASISPSNGYPVADGETADELRAKLDIVVSKMKDLVGRHKALLVRPLLLPCDSCSDPNRPAPPVWLWTDL
jgi:hypothetical protein